MLELLIKRTVGSEPGFSEKRVRWAIVLDSQEGFQGVIELGQPEQKRNRGQAFHKCPDLAQPELVSGPSPRSHFLVETASVVALLDVKPDDTKTRQKHEFFIHMLREAGKDIPQLATIARFMADESQLKKIRDAMQQNRVRPADKVTFRLDGETPLEKDYWHDWWRRFRRKLISGSRKGLPAGRMVCLATGEVVTPARTHPKVKGLAAVGGATSGDVLVGCDKDAFCSYGLKQSFNAAVSEEAAAAYTQSLNELVRQGETLAGSMVVHWFKEKLRNEKEDDPLPFLTQPPEIAQLDAQERARQLLRSLQEGKRPDLAGNRYYILVISGAGGRIMVRDWLEGEFTELVANINQWFDDLSIASFAASGYARSPRMEVVVTSLLPPRKKQQQYEDWVKPVTQVQRELLRAAVKGAAFPHSIIARLMPVHQAFILSEGWQKLLKRENDKDTALQYSILHCRMGLIRAYHLRKYRKEGNTLEKQLTPQLNEDFPEVAYQCGRLLAVLAGLQQAALGDVGAGVVQRFYAAASATPALVLGRLIANSQHHLSKLDAGLARWYDDIIAQITSRITQPLPNTFTLEEQSLFALGYYHQLARLRAGKTEKSNERKEE